MHNCILCTTTVHNFIGLLPILLSFLIYKHFSQNLLFVIFKQKLKLFPKLICLFLPKWTVRSQLPSLYYKEWKVININLNKLMVYTYMTIRIVSEIDFLFHCFVYNFCLSILRPKIQSIIKVFHIHSVSCLF